MDMSCLIIGIERLGGPAGRQLARGIALPTFGLPSDLGDLDCTMTLGDRAERGAGLDRLQLLDIADEDHLGLALARFGQHPLHLPRADHPGLVDDEHMAFAQQLAALAPLVFQARQCARSDP